MDILFTESDHKYVNIDTKERYTSMTGLISSFLPKTDWDEIADNYMVKHHTYELVFKDLAKKAGITVKQAEKKWAGDYQHTGQWIRSVWKNKSEEALCGGSYFHAWKEQEAAKLDNTVYCPVVEDKKYSQDLSNLLPEHTYLELLLFLHEFKITGQADKAKITSRGTSRVRDFKTNEKEITTDTPAYYCKKAGKKIVKKHVSPISHIPTTDYWKYALQLSGYGYILECYGYPPEALIIDQVKTKTVPMSKVKPSDEILFEDTVLETARVFVEMMPPLEVPYLREEIIAIFNYHKMNNYECI